MRSSGLFLTALVALGMLGYWVWPFELDEPETPIRDEPELPVQVADVPPAYEVFPLGPPPSIAAPFGPGTDGGFGDTFGGQGGIAWSDARSWATDVNEQDMATGFASWGSPTRQFVFRWGKQPGDWQMVKVPEGKYFSLSGIKGPYVNAVGTVATTIPKSGFTIGTAWRSDLVSSPLTLEPEWNLRRVAEDYCAASTGLADDGSMSLVIWEGVAGEIASHAALLDSAGVLTILAAGDGVTTGHMATAISPTGVVVGVTESLDGSGDPFRFWTWADGEFHDLVVPDAFGELDPSPMMIWGAYPRISRAGHLLYDATLLREDGEVVDLAPTLNELIGNANWYRKLMDLNDNEQIVGAAATTAVNFLTVTEIGRAALLIHGRRAYWLDDLLQDDEWHVAWAFGINDAGVIAGAAQRGQGQEIQAMLLLPVGS